MNGKKIYLYLLLSALISFSCSNIKSAPVNELVITNDAVFYSGDTLISAEMRRFYKNKEQRENALNVVKYKLKNTSDKRMLFLIRDTELVKVYGLQIQIKENEKLVRSGHTMVTFDNNAIDSCSFCKGHLIFEQEQEADRRFKKLGAKKNVRLFSSYLTQSVILEPNETREFSALISLPLFVELDPKTIQTPSGFDLKSDGIYTFSLIYELNKKELFDELSQEQIKELQDNNIEVFDGKIISNEVKLTPKF